MLILMHPTMRAEVLFIGMPYSFELLCLGGWHSWPVFMWLGWTELSYCLSSVLWEKCHVTGWKILFLSICFCENLMTVECILRLSIVKLFSMNISYYFNWLTNFTTLVYCLISLSSFLIQTIFPFFSYRLFSGFHV